jgi:2-oxoglutarate dehydrogenase E2 component (dihydrolipoamide succinyltransferase)
MGESVAEATLTAWLKEVGDPIEADEAVFEIATDKVDSEVPSEVEGVLVEKRFAVDDVIAVGAVVAVIELSGSKVESATIAKPAENPEPAVKVEPEVVAQVAKRVEVAREVVASNTPISGDRFYSPLVRNMAREEGISLAELDRIPGTGKEGRVTKNDMLAYLDGRKQTKISEPATQTSQASPEPKAIVPAPVSAAATEVKVVEKENHWPEGDEIIPMNRMGKLIAKHMMDSISTSAHVQSFVEVDVTNVVAWREKVKRDFEMREGEKLTFTPLFMEAVAKALKKFPMMNISVDGENIVKHKNINLGMAAALADGNLIVPVIKNADQLNLVGMARAVNDLAKRARNGALKPDEIKEGTYTVTNVGTFGSIFGTPIINQPQVGILALGAIRKLPSVIETPSGDFIGIRSKMFLSHSYDHRVINGALGGMFVRAVADYLEAWDLNREV